MTGHYYMGSQLATLRQAVPAGSIPCDAISPPRRRRITMIKDRVRQLLRYARRGVSAQRENVLLRRLRPIACVLSSLGQADENTLATMFSDVRISHEWQDTAPRLAALGI